MGVAWVVTVHNEAVNQGLGRPQHIQHMGYMSHLYIYLHEWFIFLIRVGKYTIVTWDCLG